MEAARREDWRRDSAISMGSLGGESLRKASPPKEPPVLDERHESWHQTVTQKMLHKVRSSISSIFDLAAIGESEL